MSLLLLLVATTTTSFVIEPPSCPPEWFDAASLERMLLADTSSAGRVFVAVMVPECPRPNDVQIAVLRADHPPRQSRIDLDGVPRALALRTLALTIGEILEDQPLAPPPAPIVPKPPEADPTNNVTLDHEASVGRPARLSLEPFIRVIGYPSTDTVLWGGGARADVRLFSVVSATLGVGAFTSGVRESFGDIRLTTLGAELGLNASFELGIVRTNAGAFADVGRAMFTTNTSDGQTDRDATLIRTGLKVALVYAIIDSIGVGLELRGGSTIRGVQALAGSTETLGADGVFVEAQLGVTFDVLR